MEGRKFLAVSAMLLLAISLSGQPGISDSLLIQLENVKSDSQKVDILVELGKVNLFLSLEKAQAYGKIALLLSLDKNYLKGEAESLFLLGSANFHIGKHPESERYLSESFNRFQILENDKGMGKVLYQLSLTYSKLGLDDKALKCAKEAYLIFERSDQKIRNIDALNQLGYIYEQLGEYTTAVGYYERVLDQEISPVNIESITKARYQLGKVFLAQGETEKAKRHFTKSLVIAKRWSNINGIILFNLGLAEVFLNKGEIRQALNIGGQAFTNQDALEDKHLQAKVLFIRGQIYHQAGIYIKAIQYLNESLDLAVSNSDHYQEAEIYEQMYLIYREMDEFEEALHFHEKFKEKDDRISDERKAVLVKGVELRYNVKQKQAEIDFLNEESHNQKNRFNQRQTILSIALLSIGLLLVMGIMLFKSYRKEASAKLLQEELNAEVKRKNKEIEQKADALAGMNERMQGINAVLQKSGRQTTEKLRNAYQELATTADELDLFMYKSSHDLRGPVTTLSGLVHVAKLSLKDPMSMALFEKVEITAERMSRMISKLLFVQEIKQANAIEKEEIDFPAIVEQIKYDFEQEIKDGNVRISTNVLANDPIMLNKTLARIIIQNLLENGIYFRKPNSDERTEIYFHIHEKGNYLHIHYYDNGIGIPNQYKEKVFEMFFRGTIHSKGNGLGLYLTKKAVDQLGGTIELESIANQYTSMLIKIPF